MKNYTVVVDPYDRVKGYPLHVFVLHANGGAAVPVRYYLDETALLKALTKLKFADRFQAEFLAASKSGKDHQMITIPLSDEDVAEFI